jgi:type II secretory pathway component GspD/PulD (secretin)
MTFSIFRGACLAVCLATAALSQESPSSAAQAVGGPTHRQNFNFSNMEIRSAFKALSASGRVDIVVAPNVTGQNVNLQLTDKTWQEAMLILCQMYSLKYLVEEGYLYVQNVADFNKSSVENAAALQQAGSMAPLMRDIIKLKNAKARISRSPSKGCSPRAGASTWWSATTPCWCSTRAPTSMRYAPRSRTWTWRPTRSISRRS